MATQITAVVVRVLLVSLVVSATSAPALAALDDRRVQNAWDAADDSIDDLRVSESAMDAIRSVERGTTAFEDDPTPDLRSAATLDRALRSVDGFRALGDVLSPLVVLLGYSRHDDSDPLANDRREAIYERIERSPGIHVTKLADETRTHRSTVRYHLRMLDREGLIAGETVRGKHRLYTTDAADATVLAALSDAATADLLRTIERVEPASVSVLATELDRAPSTISYHLSRLAEDDLVDREREGNAVHTTLSAHVRDALRSPSPPSAASTGRADD